MNIEDNILITGGSGLVGTALIYYLKSQGFKNIQYPSSAECNLLDSDQTNRVFKKIKPDYIFHLAGFVKGIIGNKNRKGESFYKNTLINTHVVHAAMLSKCKKIVAMGSGCVYPFPSPEKLLIESMVFLGPPHESEDSYAHSKRAMLTQLISYKQQYDMEFAFVISGNLYGPNDLFDVNEGHVVPSLVKKFHDAAKVSGTVEIWGDGSAQRDFLYSMDAARGLLAIMKKLNGAVNLGSGSIHSIRNVVDELTKIYSLKPSQVLFNSEMPNGQDYRAYDLSVLNSSNFHTKYNLQEGLTKTAEWFDNNYDTLRKIK